VKLGRSFEKSEALEVRQHGAPDGIKKGKSRAVCSNAQTPTLQNSIPSILHAKLPFRHSIRVAMALNNGSVGIGTTTPSTKLQVVGDTTLTGNLTVSGNIAAKYQDVAEWVPTLRPVSPGTVMVIDRERANSVEASAHAYDTRVAGLVSARPGWRSARAEPAKSWWRPPAESR
jgi:hypothetical protein